MTKAVLFVLVAMWQNPDSNSPVIKELKYYEYLSDCYEASRITTENMKDIEGFIRATCLTSTKYSL